MTEAEKKLDILKTNVMDPKSPGSPQMKMALAAVVDLVGILLENQSRQTVALEKIAVNTDIAKR